MSLLLGTIVNKAKSGNGKLNQPWPVSFVTVNLIYGERYAGKVLKSILGKTIYNNGNNKRKGREGIKTMHRSEDTLKIKWRYLKNARMVMKD